MNKKNNMITRMMMIMNQIGWILKKMNKRHSNSKLLIKIK